MTKLAVYAGHGGTDPGALGPGNLQEKDYTLAVSNRVTQILRDAGYTVLNNRITDVNRSINADARKANEADVDGVIEIHLNSNEGTPQTGTETYYSVNGGKGKDLAQAINKQIVKLGYVDRGTKTRTRADGEDYFGIIRLTDSPTVLVETAFINNPKDMAKYNVNDMAEAIAAGIMAIYPRPGGSLLTIADGSWYIRSAPNKKGTITGYAYGGEKYPFTDVVNGWYKVEQGYIAPNAVKSTSSGSAKSKGRSTGQGVRIHTGPGKEYAAESYLEKGQLVDILDDFDGWYYVATPSGTGWVSKDYIQLL